MHYSAGHTVAGGPVNAAMVLRTQHRLTFTLLSHPSKLFRGMCRLVSQHLTHKFPEATSVLLPPLPAGPCHNCFPRCQDGSGRQPHPHRPWHVVSCTVLCLPASAEERPRCSSAWLAFYKSAEHFLLLQCSPAGSTTG